jgi:hypothetical protein
MGKMQKPLIFFGGCNCGKGKHLRFCRASNSQRRGRGFKPNSNYISHLPRSFLTVNSLCTHLQLLSSDSLKPWDTFLWSIGSLRAQRGGQTANRPVVAVLNSSTVVSRRYVASVRTYLHSLLRCAQIGRLSLYETMLIRMSFNLAHGRQNELVP